MRWIIEISEFQFCLFSADYWLLINQQYFINDLLHFSWNDAISMFIQQWTVDLVLIICWSLMYNFRSTPFYPKFIVESTIFHIVVSTLTINGWRNFHFSTIRKLLFNGWRWCWYNALSTNCAYWVMTYNKDIETSLDMINVI